jgi:hypothetical protein
MGKNNKPLTQLIAEEQRLKSGKGQSSSCPFQMYVDMSSENEKSPRAKRAKAGTGTIEHLQKDSEAIQKNPPWLRKNEMPAETVVNPAAPVPAKKRKSVSRFENIVIFAYTSRPKSKPGQVMWQQSVFLFILNFPRASSQQTQ